MPKKKEPMIGKESRPTAIDYDAPISNWLVRDLVAVVNAQIEILKPEKELSKPEKEILKPEKELSKPEKETLKPEKELSKPEKETLKPEKELSKPEKEILKPEKELSKPEKPFDIPDLVEKVAIRIVDMLEQRGLFK